MNDTSELYADQVSLDDLLKQAPLPIDEVIRHGIHIARALEHHGNGSGGLAPCMITVGSKHAIVKDKADDPKAVVLLAPEILLDRNADRQGENYEVPDNQVADVWSLGVALFTLLTGHSPFGGITTGQRIKAITRSRPHSRCPQYTSRNPG